MWPTVTVGDVEKRWRPLSDAEKIVAEARIEDATTELQYRLREQGVNEASPDELWQLIYTRTVADMVHRYLLNPEAWSTVTEAIDDWSQTKRRDSTVASGLLYVTDEEIAKLIPLGMRRRRGAFSVTLGTT